MITSYKNHLAKISLVNTLSQFILLVHIVQGSFGRPLGPTRPDLTPLFPSPINRGRGENSIINNAYVWVLPGPLLSLLPSKVGVGVFDSTGHRLHCGVLLGLIIPSDGGDSSM